MSNLFKSQLDALIGPAFKAAGLADEATFRRGHAAPIQMAEVYVDDDVEVFGGGDTQVPQLRTTIRLFKRFDIPLPVRGDIITVGADVYTIDALSDQDSSSYVVIVKEGK